MVGGLLTASCGESKKDPAPSGDPSPLRPDRSEEFRRRFVEADWDDVGDWEPRDLMAGLRRYQSSEDPVYPRESKQARSLHRFVFAAQKPPAQFHELFGAHDRKEVDEYLQKRDLVCFCVLTASLRYVVRKAPDQAHYDLIAYAGVHFAFDPVYGEAYTHTGSEIGDFFTDPGFQPRAETAVALGKQLPAYLAQWRRRSTDRATSTFFGIVLRHLGAPGAVALVGEFAGCNEDERYDLLARLRREDELLPPARQCLVGALTDESYDVREAAFSALEAHQAPIDGLDASAREEDIARVLPALRQWAKTRS